MSEIKLEQVGKVYAGDVRAVDDVNLTIASGEFMVLVGPSGCGKSTLLRMVAGLEEVTEGEIWIGDREVARLGSARPRHRDGLPELRALPAPDRGEEPRLRPQGAEDAEGRDRAARPGGRPHARARGSARPPPRCALGRPAPARRDGPRDRARAGGVPDGRAALEPRREAPRRHARRAGAAARAPRRSPRSTSRTTRSRR